MPKSGGLERIGLRRAIFGSRRALPVNRSAPKTAGNLPLSAVVVGAESMARMGTGGARGIRVETTQAMRCQFQMYTSMYWQRRLRVPDLNLSTDHTGVGIRKTSPSSTPAGNLVSCTFVRLLIFGHNSWRRNCAGGQSPLALLLRNQPSSELC
jgi:hypothetical protein